MTKTFTKKFKKIIVVLFLFACSWQLNAQCTASFAYTINPAGNVIFASTSTGTAASTQYNWNFGNFTSSTSGPTTSVSYSANGVYTVYLQIYSAVPTCSAWCSQTISITNTVTCNLNANFTYTLGVNGLVNFESTTTGTAASTTYTWDFGNSSTGSGATTSNVYASNGTYSVQLSAIDNASCFHSTWNWITVTNLPCGLNANFIWSQTNGNVSFTSTSTGTQSPGWTTYDWNFVNGNTVSNFSNVDPTSILLTNGTYTVMLQVANTQTPSPVCTSSISQVIVVNSNTCNLAASFNFTQNAGGLVNFASTSTGTIPSMVYTWDFGDGNTLAGGPTTSHTYTYAGNHNVSMTITDPNNSFCKDSTVTQININSIPCVANSNFTMNMISSGYWNAIPAYPYNIVSASWDWGDNTTSQQLITTHTYNPIGVYTICLSVTVSCGATGTTCTTYTIQKTTCPVVMAYINVIMPQNINLGNTKQILNANNNLIIYPNPSNGNFEISLLGFNENNAVIKVFDLTGSEVYKSQGQIENGNLIHTIRLDKPSCIYFIRIETDSGTLTKKIILKD